MNDFNELRRIPCLRKNIARIESEYEKFRDAEIPELTEELFNSFYATGLRLEYESKYFIRRGALLTSAMMCLIYGKDEHFEALFRMIELILSEKTWALPAHVPEGAPQPERVIDLFSAETGHALTEICFFLSDRIPEALQSRINDEVKKRILEPFLEETFAWESFDNNWAAVCGGAVGMTLLYAFPREFDLAENRIINTLNSYLSGFGADGVSTEGLGYLNYGLWYFTGFADLYMKRRRVNLFDNPKVRSIAMCQQNMILTAGSIISYGDCERNERFSSGLAHYYRNLYGDDIKIAGYEISDGIDSCYRFLPCVRTLMWTDERLAGLKEAAPTESYFADCGWYINRGKKFAFTAKCGNNGVSHNHNDVGCFIIANDEGQLIADFGSGEYTREYFGAQRYKYLQTSSRGHSVPIIDGKYQLAGKEFAGTVIKHDGGVFEMDIAKAYGGAVKSLMRKFTVYDGGVKLVDRFEFEDERPHEITERFVSVIKPEIRGGRVVIGDMTLVCDARASVGCERLKNHAAEDDILYFVDYIAEKRFEITFSL